MPSLGIPGYQAPRSLRIRRPSKGALRNAHAAKDSNLCTPLLRRPRDKPTLKPKLYLSCSSLATAAWAAMLRDATACVRRSKQLCDGAGLLFSGDKGASNLRCLPRAARLLEALALRTAVGVKLACRQDGWGGGNVCSEIRLAFQCAPRGSRSEGDGMKAKVHIICHPRG